MFDSITDLVPLIGGGGLLSMAIGGFVFRKVIGTMFGGNIKLIIYGVLAVAILAAVGFHFIQVANLRSTISDKNAEISAIKADMEKALTSNASLEKANDALRRNNQNIITELANLRSADTATKKELDTTLARLRDTDRKLKLSTVREGPRVESLISIINKSAACETQNFYRKGRCVNGEFIAEGAAK